MPYPCTDLWETLSLSSCRSSFASGGGGRLGCEIEQRWACSWTCQLTSLYAVYKSGNLHRWANICKNNHVNKSEKLILFMRASSLCDLCLMLFNCWFVFFQRCTAINMGICYIFFYLLLCSVWISLSLSSYTLCANNNQCENLRTDIYARVRSFENFIIYWNCIEQELEQEKWMRYEEHTGDEIFHFCVFTNSRWTNVVEKKIWWERERMS